METKKKLYENLVQDLLKGQVEGLEEKYHEIKFTCSSFTYEHIQEILMEVEKNYNVHLTKVAKRTDSNDLR